MVYKSYSVFLWKKSALALSAIGNTSSDVLERYYDAAKVVDKADRFEGDIPCWIWRVYSPSHAYQLI